MKTALWRHLSRSLVSLSQFCKGFLKCDGIIFSDGRKNRLQIHLFDGSFLCGSWNLMFFLSPVFEGGLKFSIRGSCRHFFGFQRLHFLERCTGFLTKRLDEGITCHNVKDPSHPTPLDVGVCARRFISSWRGLHPQPKVTNARNTNRR